jgi:hypothetical protein
MNNYDYVFYCLGWEDRCLKGIEHTLSTHRIGEVKAISISEFSVKCIDVTSKLKNHEKWPQLTEAPLLISMEEDFKAWKKIESLIDGLDLKGRSVLLDITTMPRFLIWFLCHFLEKSDANIDYIYYKPLDYADEPSFTTDPREPRLILKHSGILYPNRKTVLLIQSGFDFDRVDQLIKKFEPEKVIFAYPQGNQFDNNVRNVRNSIGKFGYNEEQISFVEIDSFSGDHGFKTINESLVEFKDEYNVLMCSLGPKPSAIALFRLNLAIPEFGLVYIPVYSYGDMYSKGINLDNIVCGVLNIEGH